VDLLTRYRLVEPVIKPSKVARAIVRPVTGSPDASLYPAKIIAPWVTPGDGMPHSLIVWAIKAVIAIAVSGGLNGANAMELAT